MEWCDHNKRVIRWGSESFTIRYLHPIKKTMSRYYPDGIVWLDEGGSHPIRYVVEIKPDAQTRPPTLSNRKKKQTVLYEQVQWAINQAKWEAAQKWCHSRGMKFIIITEKPLGI